MTRRVEPPAKARESGPTGALPGPLALSAGAVERRTFAVVPELRDVGGRAARVRGYAAVVNQVAQLWPGYAEVVRPGAFRDTLADGKRKLLLWDHQSSEPLAATDGRPPLKLWEDAQGLAFEAELPLDLTAGRELEARLRRGIVAGMSFGFRALEAPEHVRPGGGVLRELHKVELFEVSAVSFPAYAGTTAELASLRSALGHGAEDDLEDLLRLLGGASRVDDAMSLEDLLGG